MCPRRCWRQASYDRPTRRVQSPGMEKVEEMAQRFRLEQARLAVEAEGTMGHSEARVNGGRARVEDVHP